jgi:uncharacterized protein
MKEIIQLVLIGIGAGLLSGLFGVGGGILIVPALVIMMGLEQKMAQGTSVAAIALPLIWLSYQIFSKTGNVDFRSAGIIALGFFVGGYFAVQLLPKIDAVNLARMFGGLLVVVGLKMLLGK